MSAEVKKCNCKHEGQDKLHGTGMRVCNPNSKKEFNCTVCGSRVK